MESEKSVKQDNLYSYFKIFPGNILFVPHTGKVFQVTDKVNGVLEKLKDSTEESVAFSKAEEEILNYLGELCEEEASIRGRREGLYSEFKSLSFIVTHNCNMNCIYCYAHDSYEEEQLTVISLEKAVESVEWFIDEVKREVGKLEDIREESEEVKLGFNFFGGEPLLAYPRIKEIVNYIEEKSFSSDFYFMPLYSITTNGTQFTEEILDFLNSRNFSMVVSIDGPPDIHNRNRPFKNGKGTYSKIREGLELLKKFNPLSSRTTLRATFFPGKGEVYDIVTHLKSLGFERVGVEMAGIKGKDRKNYDKCYKKLKRDFDPIFERMENSLNDSEWPDEYMPRTFEYLFKVLYKRELKEIFCGAGQTFYEISAYGGIYPCQRFVGEKDWKIGNIAEGIEREDIVEKFYKLKVESSEKCKKCWLRFFCGGGCPYNNWLVTGSIDEPDPMHCAYMNLVFENLISLYGKHKKFINDFLDTKEEFKKDFYEQIKT